MTTDQAEIKRLARRVLDTHDALQAAHESEPSEMGDDDLPVDALGWLAWSDNVYRPAHTAWKAAITEFRTVVPPPHGGQGLHPFTFRPECENILAGAN